MIKLEDFLNNFKETQSLLSNKDTLNIFKNLNTTLNNYINYKRLKTVEKAFKKIHYTRIDEKEKFRRSKSQYIGIIEESNDFSIFSIRTEKFLNKEELFKVAEKQKKEYKTKDLQNLVNFFVDNIKNEINDIKLTDSVSIFMLKRSEEMQISAAYKKEMYKLFKSKIEKRFNSKDLMKEFNKIIYKNLSNEKIKELSLKITGSSSDFYNSIEKHSKKVSLDDMIYTVNTYPLLTYLACNIKTMPKREKDRIDNFYKNYNKNLNLIENVKNYFDLNEKQLDKISKLSWQKYTILKNRPIILIDFIKLGLDFEKIQKREDIKRIYLYYYYLQSNNRFVIKAQSLAEAADLNITRFVAKDLFKIYQKEMYNLGKHNRYFLSGENTYKIEIKDFKETITRMRLEDIKSILFKTKLEIDKKEYKLIPKVIKENPFSSFSYINNENEEILIKIKGITRNGLTIETNLKDFNLEEKINEDFKNLFNQRVKSLNYLNRKNMIEFLQKFFRKDFQQKAKNKFGLVVKNKGSRYREESKKISKIISNKKFDEISESLSLYDII